MTGHDTGRAEAGQRERAREIAERRERLRKGDRELREGGDLADCDQHEGDVGTETHEEELDETTEIILSAEAQEVELALGRLAEGTYRTTAGGHLA